MKKGLKTTGFVTIMLALLLTSTAFISNKSSNNSENTCTLTIKYSYGTKASSVKVKTEVSGGISCCGGRDFYTDKNGEVTLKWVAGCKLTKIYVKGTGYNVNYEDGKSYNLTLN